MFNKSGERQKLPNGRRKWTAVRRIRQNVSDILTYNAGLSSDFEWDDDGFVGYHTISNNGNSFAELTDIVSDERVRPERLIEARKVDINF